MNFKIIINKLMIKKWIVLSVVLGIVTLTATFWLVSTATSKYYYKGIYVDDVDLSGLTPKDAKILLETNLRNKTSRNKLILQSTDGKWIINQEDISLNYLIGKALQDAYDVGRKGNIFSRIIKIISLKFSHENINSEIMFDKDILRDYLLQIKAKVDKESKNCSVLYKNGNVIIEKETIGKLLDVDTSLKLIENHILENNFAPIILQTQTKNPKILSGDVEGINGKISSSTTYFNPEEYNRTENIKISCKKLNGVIILPGELFSMNKAIGPRTYKNGYKDAKVITNNEYVDGVGGGICQLTTTLYEAVLKASLEIVERQHHSIASYYAEPGQDATIADKYIDFKFKNNKNYPISISAEVTYNKIKINLLGNKDEVNYTVKLVSEVLEKYPSVKEEYIIDNSIPDFQRVLVQKPKDGCRSVLYRETYDENQKLILKEKISEDTYKPASARYKVNQNFYNILKRGKTNESQSIQQNNYMPGLF